MSLSVNPWDINFLIIFIAINMLIIAELLSPRYGKITFLFDKNKFKKATYILTMLFSISMIFRLIDIFFSA